MLDVGVTLGNRYSLVSLVGRGGMGEVWSARDTVLGRRVAVKVLLPNLAGDPGFAARFHAEARAMAALSHPGIIEIYDYGHDDGLAYLVMQFVEGESLVSLLRRTGALAPEHTLRLVIQAAEAIEAAHRQGIVHRDVKPANLLLRPDGRLALTDFGIARILAADRLTAADQIVGTSSYLAPEQVTGEEISAATDVYALGVVAYELLAGGKPFTADTPFAVALKHVHEEPPPLPDAVPAPVRALVSRAMAKDPGERWPGAAALASAASAVLASMTTAATGSSATALATPATPASAASAGRASMGPSAPASAAPASPASAASAARASAGSAAPASATSASGASASGASAALGRANPSSGPDAVIRQSVIPQAAERDSLTGEATRTTVWRDSGPSTVRRRLLPVAAAGGGVVMLAIATVLIVSLSHDRAPGQPQADGVSPSSSSSSSGPPTASHAPTGSPATMATPVTRTGGGGSTPTPANPPTTGQGTQPSTPAATATVPGMYGWKESEVTSEMRRLGLVARITYESTPDKCYAIRQMPSGGTVLQTGSPVDIVIARPTGTCKEV